MKRCTFFYLIWTICACTLGVASESASLPEELTTEKESVFVVDDNEAATATYFNRDLITIRSTSFGHTPADRAGAIERRIARRFAEQPVETIETEQIDLGVVLLLNGEAILIVGEHDKLEGTTAVDTAEIVGSRIREAVEAHHASQQPEVLSHAVLLTGIWTFAVIIVVLILLKTRLPLQTKSKRPWVKNLGKQVRSKRQSRHVRPGHH